MQTLALLLSGFSIFSALVMALTHFRCDNYKGQTLAQVMGVLLLLALAALQWVHFRWLYDGADFIHTPGYQALLFSVAPAFYLFSKPLLHADARQSPLRVMHFLPVIVALFLPFTLALPLAFMVGAGYLLWLGRSAYALRAQRSRFSLEMTILGVIFVIAVIVLVLGISLPLLSEKLFFILYASAIGCAFLLVSIALGLAPQLSDAVSEAARETYAVSTLANVDCDAMLSTLDGLMQQEYVYRDATLDLSALAQRLGLSNHQLSELINTRKGKGFSRYIREYRVTAAAKMLLAKRSMPVLAVGMAAGFSSQSSFYDAFREINGMTPGQYRKIHKQASTVGTASPLPGIRS